jgi:OmpA-OmpF porin, OOP family
MGRCKPTRYFAGIASILLSLSFSAVRAEECIRPPGYPEGLPCPLEPYETVMQEHQDRVARLKRLAAGYLNFEFSTTMLKPEEHGLADFPVEIPVLRVVADADVFFDTGSTEIRPEAIPIIYIIAESLMREPPDVSMFVAGHTDSRGSDDFNMELGTRRAEAVAAALVRRGIYQGSVYRVSFGEFTPIASNDTNAGRARNRRVEFLFAAKGEAIVDVLERQKVTLCASHISDQSGSCREVLTFFSERVQVAPGQEKKVIELKTKRELILDDPNRTRIQAEKELQKLEAETDKIKLDFNRTRVVIKLGEK